MSKVFLTRPPKPIKQMSEAEIDAWLGEVWDAVHQDSQK